LARRVNETTAFDVEAVFSAGCRAARLSRRFTDRSGGFGNPVRDFGEFLLTRENIRIPEETVEFAINISYRRHWEEPIERYISECRAGKEGGRGKDFKMRWVVSMVAEVHRILSLGGIFMYPCDERLKAAGKTGKLRLLYEANPMAMIVEQAGGARRSHTRTSRSWVANNAIQQREEMK